MDSQEEMTKLVALMTGDDAAEFQDDSLKERLLQCNTELLHNVINSVYAIDIAIALEDFSKEELSKVLNLIDDQHTADILEQAVPTLQRTIVTLLPQDTVLRIFAFMSNDDIADLLGMLPIALSKNILKRIRGQDNIQLQTLLEYPKDTAGGIMTTEYIALREELNAEEALQKIKEIGPATEVIETIFVVNSENQLLGTADLRNVFSAQHGETLEHIMDDTIITVTPEIDQEVVARLVSKYDLKAIAVINRRGSLLGIITVDDIIDVLEEEQTEDMLKFSGISGEEGVSSSVWSSVAVRLPWLMVNLCTASFAAFLIQQFEGTISQVVALSAIMPIVAATSGNSGSQTLAIIIRGITLGQINLKDDYLRVFKEMAVGSMNSAFIGSIAGVVVYFMYGNIYLSLILVLAMFFNSFIASSCGFFIPLTLNALKLDPALASSIFLTATTDIMAYLIFLGLASQFIQYLH